MGQEKPPSTLVSEKNRVSYFLTMFLFFVLKTSKAAVTERLTFCHSVPFFMCMEEKDDFPGKIVEEVYLSGLPINSKSV